MFEDVSAKAGLGSGFLPLGFGTKLFDADNDGDLDIYVTNGHVIDNVKLYQPNLSYAQKDLLYENIGGGKFRDVSAQGGRGAAGRRASAAGWRSPTSTTTAISTSSSRASTSGRCC